MGRDLLHQCTKPRLDAAILVQQVREPARAPLCLTFSDLLRLRARRRG